MALLSFIVRLFLPLKNLKRREISKLGESTAAKFLKRKGFKILERNWRIWGGEIDIIAQDKDTLVFVEVKSRTGEEYGTGKESITRSKKKTLRRASLVYLKRKGKRERVRFDVVAIEFSPSGRVKKIEWIPSAFNFTD